MDFNLAVLSVFLDSKNYVKSKDLYSFYWCDINDC